MGAANDGLRFLLELAVLGAVGVWGHRAGGRGTRWLLALGAPLLVAVVWATYVTPDGSHATGDPARLLLELAVFGAGVAALVAIGRRHPAHLLTAVVAVHLALTFPLGQR
jgi:hypothetical protein